MTISLSTGLKNAVLSGASSLAGAMNGGKIYIFGGTIPPDANTIATNATLLCTITKDGDGSTGLTFDTAGNGILPKKSTEVWKCLAANITDGTATFYRHGGSSETAVTIAGAPSLCIQGTVGTDSSFDMRVVSAALSSSFDFGPLTSYEIAL